jgi:tellurite resistance protein TehA-like permease
MLSGAICFYFVIVPAFILEKMMRGKPGPFWRYSVGVAAMIFAAAAISAQMDLCGNPERTPNIMSISAFILAAQGIFDLVLLIITYIYYYYKNKKFNAHSNSK